MQTAATVAKRSRRVSQRDLGKVRFLMPQAATMTDHPPQLEQPPVVG